MREENALNMLKQLEVLIIRKVFNESNFNNVKGPKLSPTQMNILNYMLENINNDIYQNELEKVLNLRRATVSGVLYTMEKNGLIIRSVVKDDTRKKKIVFTSKAKDIFNENKYKLDNLNTLLIKDISNEDLDTFYSVMGKMKSNLENAENIEKLNKQFIIND